MNSYLLDTNHLSPLVTPGHPLRERVLAATKLGHQFAIAAPAYNEFLFGIGVAIRAKRTKTTIVSEWGPDMVSEGGENCLRGSLTIQQCSASTAQ